MGKDSEFVYSKKGENISETICLGTQSFLEPVWLQPGAQTASLRNLIFYGKILAYSVYSVNLLKAFVD